MLESFKRAAKSLWSSAPLIIGTILLVSLVTTLIPKSVYPQLFQGNILDYLIGSVVGSVMAGNPVTSYIIGGEFLDVGVSLGAVTAFLVAWTTVGVVQFPAEASLLGKRFAVFRNLASFFFAIAIAVLIVVIL